MGFGFDEQLSFLLRRNATTALTAVQYRLSGSAQPGVHYEPLPNSVSFPAGASSVTVAVVPRQTPSGALVTLTMELVGVESTPGTQTSATIRFVSPPPPGPVECGYRYSSHPWNTRQTIGVGDGLRALTVDEFRPPIVTEATGVFSVISGELPPGVRLQADGSLTGRASAEGMFTARIQACRAAPPGTCVTTDLLVVVTATTILARTGPLAWTMNLIAVALTLTIAGLSAVRLGRAIRR
ncbi:MAG TPA: hypothetical protein VMZ73_00180 [Acidimicrobiales bacterium]|nr:hypothetical protein [Acidimicrobiales bacterium]